MRYTIRQASQSDERLIRKMVRNARINPMNLHWNHFILAVEPTGEIIGCGQVKLHNDGSKELASIVVSGEFRHQGIASEIIQLLINQHPHPLYLTCRPNLESFYERFGFSTILPVDMPKYFQRLARIARFITWLTRGREKMLVMRLD